MAELLKIVQSPPWKWSHYNLDHYMSCWSCTGSQIPFEMWKKMIPNTFNLETTFIPWVGSSRDPKKINGHIFWRSWVIKCLIWGDLLQQYRKSSLIAFYQERFVTEVLRHKLQRIMIHISSSAEIYISYNASPFRTQMYVCMYHLNSWVHMKFTFLLNIDLAFLSLRPQTLGVIFL